MSQENNAHSSLLLWPKTNTRSFGHDACIKQTHLSETNFGEDSTRVSAYSKEAPSRSIESGEVLPDTACSFTLSGNSEISITLENVPGGLSIGILSNAPPKNSTSDDSSFHLLKIDNASSDEIMFFFAARSFGLDTAVWLSSKWGWKTERPLKLLKEIREIE
jgi:hypothetical protein